jgi:hypothetical protein
MRAQEDNTTARRSNKIDLPQPLKAIMPGSFLILRIAHQNLVTFTNAQIPRFMDDLITAIRYSLI